MAHHRETIRAAVAAQLAGIAAVKSPPVVDWHPESDATQIDLTIIGEQAGEAGRMPPNTVSRDLQLRADLFVRASTYAVVDALVVQIEDAMLADDQLGATVERVMFESFEIEFNAESEFNWCQATVTCNYSYRTDGTDNSVRV